MRCSHCSIFEDMLRLPLAPPRLRPTARSVAPLLDMCSNIVCFQ